MKKFGLLTLGLVFGTSMIFSQSIAVNDTYEYLSTFETEKENGNEAEAVKALLDAKRTIEPAIKNSETMLKSNTWEKRGNVYFNIATYNSQRLTFEKDGAADTAAACYYRAVTVEKNEKGKQIIPGKSVILSNAAKLLELFGKRANAELDNKEYTKAITSYNSQKLACEAAMACDPTNTQLKDYYKGINNNIVYASMLSEDIKLAKSVSEPIAENGCASWVYTQLSKIYLSENNTEKANYWIQKGKTFHPNDTTLSIAEIDIALESGDGEKAISLINAAKAKYPTKAAEISRQEVNYYINKGDNVKAIEALENAIKNEKDKTVLTQLLMNAGIIYDQLASTEKDQTTRDNYNKLALENYNKALSIDPNNAGAYLQLGSQLVTKGNEALEAANALPFEKEKEYNELKAKSNDYFKQASTYLQKSYDLKKSEDLKKTLILLYERTNQLDKKAELEK